MTLCCHFDDMQTNANAGNTPSETETIQVQEHSSDYARVAYKGKQVHGLLLRNGVYYARIKLENAAGELAIRRVRLIDKNRQPLTRLNTVRQAVDALNWMKVKRDEGDLPIMTRAPKFSDYVARYLDFIKAGQDTESGKTGKKPATIRKEQLTLEAWKPELGALNLDRITLRHIHSHIEKRLNAGTNGRTVNLDIIALTNLLDHAIADGLIKTRPKLNKETRKRLKSTTPERPPFETADLEKLCTAAMSTNDAGEPVTKNWLQFCDYIRLLGYCGAREQEALSLRWSAVDFEHGILTIGSDLNTKNGTSRKVDLNSKLEAHLRDMLKRKAPDSQWLFPSPQRGERDVHAQTFRESLKLVRAHAAKRDPHLGSKAFHDLRHCFASYAVMAGVDFKTISEWLGHRDGGILVCKTYSHLTEKHKAAQAKRLNFEPDCNAQSFI